MFTYLFCAFLKLFKGQDGCKLPFLCSWVTTVPINHLKKINDEFGSVIYWGVINRIGIKTL